MESNPTTKKILSLSEKNDALALWLKRANEQGRTNAIPKSLGGFLSTPGTYNWEFSTSITGSNVSIIKINENLKVPYSFTFSFEYINPNYAVIGLSGWFLGVADNAAEILNTPSGSVPVQNGYMIRSDGAILNPVQSTVFTLPIANPTTLGTIVAISEDNAGTFRIATSTAVYTVGTPYGTGSRYLFFRTSANGLHDIKINIL